MNIIHKSIKYATTRDIFIPFEGRIKSCIKLGSDFEKGDELFKVEARRLLGSYSLVEDLEIRPQKALDFVTCVEGEYITKGSVIAERILPGGLMSKRVISDHEGIVSLKKVNLGYVNIFSELEAKSCFATFDGVVNDVDFARGILVENDVCQIPMFFSNGNLEDGTFGELYVLSNVDSIPSVRKMEGSFEGKIVFAGRFLYPELAIELYNRGCKYVLAGSMNYNDLRGLQVPIGLLTGFGNIYFDSIVLDFLEEFNGSQALIPKGGFSVQFPVGLNDKISRLIEQKYYTNFLRKGDIVRSRDLDSFGIVGEVLSCNEDTGLADILIQDGTECSVSLENLERYKEDYSIMRTRIF